MTDKKQAEGTLPANLGNQLDLHGETPENPQLPDKGLKCSLGNSQKEVKVTEK